MQISTIGMKGYQWDKFILY